MYDMILHQDLSNPYMRLIRIIDGKIWDVTNSEATSSPAYSDTDVQLSKNTDIGGIPVMIPANLPAGEWYTWFYDAASPANSDAIEFAKRISWTGSSLLGAPVAL